MGKETAIEWTDHSFNPWWGCAKVSPGCDHCYAEAWAKRTGTAVWGVDAPRRAFGDKHWNEPLKWQRAAVAAGKRARVFCASMADVFDKNAPAGARDRLWALIRATPDLDWQLLTKRIGNVARMLPADWGNGYANVWLGISVVNQDEADRDIPKLLATPANVRFLSCEPLLGPINFSKVPGFNRIGLSLYGWWIISGGESGPKARPSHPDWHRSLRDQCAAAGVPFLFKQWGEWWPMSQMRDGESDGFYDPKHGTPRQSEYDSSPPPRAARTTVLQLDGTQEFAFPAGAMTCYQVGKKAAGRTLDGITHDGFPS
jgi:protein gp37